MNIKPKMFTDVVKLSPELEAEEKQTKDNVMKMSLEEDSDVMSLLGGDASDASRITNTTTSSESSLNGQSLRTDSVECFDELMDIENRVREVTAVDVENQGMVRFSVWISFAEIYNEQIFDLLEQMPKKKSLKRTVLKLSEDKKGSPYVKGLKYINVRSADEAYKLMTIGQRNLRTACTKLNHCSSRSHCIFNIKVLRVMNKDNPVMARVSMLTLCDLAGSERSSKTQATGDRLKEASNINTSLHTLGRCIESLRYNQTHKDNSRLIPFREGKLTRLFQNFFCGKGKAAMIVNVNKCASMFDETFKVFKFSAIAKQLMVVQKPDPPPKLPQPKLNARGSSCAWAHPSHQEVHAKTSLAISVPLPSTSDDDLDESYGEMEALHEMITNLKKQLVKERDERLMDEVRIREEVCKEMMSQIVKIETVYSERLKEQQVMHEEHLEKKIELLKSIHAKDKKPSNGRTEHKEDEWVSGVMFHAEKAKVEAKERAIVQLQAELNKVKEQLKGEQRKSEQLQVEVNTKEDSLRIAGAGDLSQQSLVDTMSQQLEKSRDLLQEKENEVKELNETLSEAAETFMQKESKIKKLEEALKGDEEKLKQQEETIRELQKLLDKSGAALEVANEKLTSRDIQILDLQTGMEEQQGSQLSCTSAQLSSTSADGTSDSYVDLTDSSVGQLSSDQRDIADYFVDAPQGCEGDKVLRLVITPVKTTKLVPKQTKSSLLRIKGTPSREKVKGNVKRKIATSESCPTPGSAAKRQRVVSTKNRRVSTLKVKTTTRSRKMSGATGAKYNLRNRR